MAFVADGVIASGRYAGQALADVAERDRAHLRWALDSREHLDLTIDEESAIVEALGPEVALVPAPPSALVETEVVEGVIDDPPVAIVAVHSREIVLTAEQQAAVDSIVEWAAGDSGRSLEQKFFCLTGPAGAGKTTIIRNLANQLGRRVVWSAMTGKAAARMRDATGLKAKTTHSALYHPPREVDNREEKKVDLVFDQVRQDVTASVLVIDEASMITEDIRRDIENSAYEKVLLVGDPYQIPPVGDDYSVFARVPGPRLTEVKRTAGAIVQAATILRETDEICGRSFAEGGSRYDFDLYDDLDEAFLQVVGDWLADREDHIVITWKNVNRMHVNQTIRRRLGFEQDAPQPGEPVVICQNMHQAGLMNGDMVRVARWLDEEPVVFEGTSIEGRPFKFEARYLEVALSEAWQPHKTVLALFTGGKAGIFDGDMEYVGAQQWKSTIGNTHAKLLREGKQGLKVDPIPITYGYCLTCHKAQGSQYRRVTTYVPRDLSNRRFNAPTKLPDGRVMSLSTRWIYTALTRAIERSTLVVGR